MCRSGCQSSYKFKVRTKKATMANITDLHVVNTMPGGIITNTPLNCQRAKEISMWDLARCPMCQMRVVFWVGWGLHRRESLCKKRKNRQGGRTTSSAAAGLGLASPPHQAVHAQQRPLPPPPSKCTLRTSCEGCMLEVRWVVAVWYSHVQIWMGQWQGLRAPVVSMGDIWCTKMYVQGVDN